VLEKVTLNSISKNLNKICFISGKYMPGRCGVSDYIDLLMQNLKSFGVESIHFSIDDLSNLSLGKNTLPMAKLYSLQFAPFAFSSSFLFHKKLIPLQDLLKDKNLHINFHEIWTGDYPFPPLRERLRGWLQKSEICRFINATKAKSITSSNSAAIDRLIKNDVEASYLYLFGNIPFCNKSVISPEKKTLKVVFFGTLYPNFPYKRLINYLITLSKLNKWTVKIILLGRQRENYGVKKLLCFCESNKISVRKTGKLTSGLVSEELQACTFGVSTTPYDVIGKSGATAAMLEHRLPLLAFDDGDTPNESLFIPDQFKDQIFLINDDSSTVKLLQYMDKPRKPFFDGVAHTANKMLELVS
jgi:hypothetical protein